MWFKKDDELKKPESDAAKPVYVRDPDFIKLSTLQLLKILVIDKFLKGKNDSYKLDNGNLVIIEEPPPPPNKDKVYHLALVVNTEVKDVLRTHERLAALLTSEHEFIAFDPEVDHVHVHSVYQDGEFIAPKDQPRFNHSSDK